MYRKRAILLFLFSTIVQIESTFGATTATDWISLYVNERFVIKVSTVSSASMNLSLQETAAGYALKKATYNDMYVQYTSISNSNKKITVKINSAPAIPTGTTLTLCPQPFNTSNVKGDVGDRITSAITLSTSEQTIISGIGKGATGSSPTDGYRLYFEWIPNLNSNAYSTIKASAVTITVVFTIKAI